MVDKQRRRPAHRATPANRLPDRQPTVQPPPPINDMEPNIRLQPQDTYLLVSRLDQLIRVCSKISNMIMAIFIINIGIALIYFIAVVLMGIGAAAASR